MRSKLLVSLLLIVTFMMGVTSVNAATNPYNQKEKVPNNEQDKMTNCTWYAWQQAYDNLGVELPSFGNATSWYVNAKALGWHVGEEAKANSIAVWGDTNEGHVGYVVSVNGSQMTVNEGGVYDVVRDVDDEGNIISIKYTAYNGTGIYNANQLSTLIGESRYEDDINSPKLIGFIYLDYIPSTTTSITTTKKSTSVNNIEKTVVEVNEDEVSKKDEVNDTNNLKGTLPYLILISLSLLFLLLVLAKITKNEK